jgi:hypothetical protein
MEDKNIFEEKFTVELTGGEMLLVIDSIKNMMLDVERFFGGTKTEKDFSRVWTNIAQKFLTALKGEEKNV